MNAFIYERLTAALGGAPDVVEELTRPFGLDHQIWDFRPDPERFTLREIVAHLADIEFLWMDRFIRSQKVSGTQFERVDSAQLVLDNNYAESNPNDTLCLYQHRRKILLETVALFTDEDWAKLSVIPGPLGTITLEYQAGFVAIHDGYHTGQIAQWIVAWNQSQH